MHYAVLKIFTNVFNWLTYLKRETSLFQISAVFWRFAIHWLSNHYAK